MPSSAALFSKSSHDTDNIIDQTLLELDSSKEKKSKSSSKSKIAVKASKSDLKALRKELTDGVIELPSERGPSPPSSPTNGSGAASPSSASTPTLDTLPPSRRHSSSADSVSERDRSDTESSRRRSISSQGSDSSGDRRNVKSILKIEGGIKKKKHSVQFDMQKPIPPVEGGGNSFFGNLGLGKDDSIFSFPIWGQPVTASGASSTAATPDVKSGEKNATVELKNSSSSDTVDSDDEAKVEESGSFWGFDTNKFLCGISEMPFCGAFAPNSNPTVVQTNKGGRSARSTSKKT